ncbi:MAG: hypothetical protein DME24_21560 [Verrucomicrobia bacterium]|nr:MAG: hypothetical protein DME24_21560 [Verrucomicrobiota bacterium]
MTKESPNFQNPNQRHGTVSFHSAFGFRHSFGIRHSSFVIIRSLLAFADTTRTAVRKGLKRKPA